jgi:hypothetical protein
MERKLTDEQEAQISMFMRVFEFLRKNENVFRENEEFMKQYESFKNALPKILDELSEEERDILLERYKEEIEFLRSENNNSSL